MSIWMVKMIRRMVGLMLLIPSATAVAGQEAWPDVSSMEQVGWGMVEHGERTLAIAYHKAEGRHVVFLEKPDTPGMGTSKWHPVDYIAFELRGAGHHFEFGLCSRGQEYDSRLMAVVETVDRERQGNPIMAWKIDFRHQVIREVPTGGITCKNPGYGA